LNCLYPLVPFFSSIYAIIIIIIVVVTIILPPPFAIFYHKDTRLQSLPSLQPGIPVCFRRISCHQQMIQMSSSKYDAKRYKTNVSSTLRPYFLNNDTHTFQLIGQHSKPSLSSRLGITSKDIETREVSYIILFNEWQPCSLFLWR